jgi:hypothetical protein
LDLAPQELEAASRILTESPFLSLPRNHPDPVDPRFAQFAWSFGRIGGQDDRGGGQDWILIIWLPYLGGSSSVG